MITKMLELSTGHLSRHTVDLIEFPTDDIPVFYDKEGYGWFFPVLDQKLWPHTIPDDLRNVLAFAQKQECSWVMFDRDADAIDGLPHYEW